MGPGRSDYENRLEEVATFNSRNAFKKRGLALVPMRWRHHLAALKRMSVQVAAYNWDGSVAVSIGGIEMGQGINTKVAQVVAKELGIEDANLITVC